jgi:hypothetical protein
MEFVIWVETRIAGRTVDRQEVAKIERPTTLAAMEEVGLTLQDGKTVVREVQRRVVEMQFEVESKLRQHCLNCQSLQTIKDSRTRSLRTVFGVTPSALLPVPSMRLPRRRGRHYVATIVHAPPTYHP